MFVALDKDGNRIYADSKEKIEECYCQGCREKLIHRTGKIKVWHFAHQSGSTCKWAEDKDNKSEWHRRMQAYFPRENQEIRFTDNATGTVHIADVYIPEKKVVIEFQHSPISEDEFRSRTEFHLVNGRRIVWIFDEESDAAGQIGRFKAYEFSKSSYPYHTLKWMRCPRKCLKTGPNIYNNASRYSICIYHGAEEEEGDIIHHIVREYDGFEFVDFSFCNIKMEIGMDVELMFIPDGYWQTVEPFKSVFDEYERNQARMINAYFPTSNMRYKRKFHF